jgi:flagellar protein FlgJ
VSDLPAITGATGTSGDLSRTASTANLKKAGEKFEAMFDGMMLKSMRQAKLADPLFDSKALDTFTEMSDTKVAQSMAEHQPLGIGRAMTEFLSRSAAAKSSLNQGDATSSR